MFIMLLLITIGLYAGSIGLFAAGLQARRMGLRDNAAGVMTVGVIFATGAGLLTALLAG